MKNDLPKNQLTYPLQVRGGDPLARSLTIPYTFSKYIPAAACR